MRHPVYSIRLFQNGHLTQYYHARNPQRIERQVARWLRQPGNAAQVRHLGQEVHLLQAQCLQQGKKAGT